MKFTLAVAAALAAIFVAGNAAHAQDRTGSEKASLIDNQYYETGWSAYQQDDYLKAVKYLFAFKAIAEEELDKHPETRMEVTEALRYAERKLVEAIVSSDRPITADKPVVDGSDGLTSMCRKWCEGSMSANPGSENGNESVPDGEQIDLPVTTDQIGPPDG